jgi:hypothetical protein
VSWTRLQIFGRNNRERREFSVFQFTVFAFRQTLTVRSREMVNALRAHLCMTNCAFLSFVSTSDFRAGSFLS